LLYGRIDHRQLPALSLSMLFEENPIVRKNQA